MLELAARLRGVLPGVPILLATSPADAIGAAELMRAGVPDVVPWPIAAAETVVALQDSLTWSRRQVPDRFYNSTVRASVE
jgi:DNA-binding NtrC family response regulator